MVWIVVASLFLVGVALRFLKNLPPSGEGWMHVVTVDGKGRETHLEWVKIKEPDEYLTDGAAHLRPYVDRLLASPGWFTSVSVFSPDGERGFGVDKMDGQVRLELFFQRHVDSQREAKARSFFQSRGIEPVTDYVESGDGTRVLTWPLESDADEIERTCRRALTELCGVAPEEGLNITYEEHEDRRRS